MLLSVVIVNIILTINTTDNKLMDLNTAYEFFYFF